MHELSIAISILDVAGEQLARLEPDTKVAAIHLKLGPHAGVIKEALLSAFELAREGTVFAESDLIIHDEPLIVHCAMCLTDGPPLSIQDMRCPKCLSPTPQILRGRELEISALEVVDEAPIDATPAP